MLKLVRYRSHFVRFRFYFVRILKYVSKLTDKSTKIKTRKWLQNGTICATEAHLGAKAGMKE